MKGRVMAYARLSDDASIESPYEKAEPSESLLQNSARYFSYKNLFGASLVLWIATLATLAWVLGQKPSTYGNHATNSLPFPPGMHQRCRKKSLHALLIKGSSAVPHDHFRSKPKISLYSQRCRRDRVVGSDAQYYSHGMNISGKTDKELIDDGGIISIASPQRYQLPVSYKDRNVSGAEVYSMSMFHQLHCLVSSAQ
jgi:hypothetical protein